MPCTGRSESHTCYDLGGEPDSYCAGCVQRYEWPHPRRMTRMNIANVVNNLAGKPRDGVFDDPIWATYHFVCAALTVKAIDIAIEKDRRRLDGLSAMMATRY